MAVAHSIVCLPMVCGGPPHRPPRAAGSQTRSIVVVLAGLIDDYYAKFAPRHRFVVTSASLMTLSILWTGASYFGESRKSDGRTKDVRELQINKNFGKIDRICKIDTILVESTSGIKKSRFFAHFWPGGATWSVKLGMAINNRNTAKHCRIA